MFLVKQPSTNFYPNNIISINTNQSTLSSHSDHQSSCLTNNNNQNNHPPIMKPGDTVYDSNGTAIGILDEYMNVIRNNGAINIMRPMTPLPIPTLPPIINNNINNIKYKSDSKLAMQLHLRSNNTLSNNNPTSCNIKQQCHNKTITRETMKRGRHIPSNQKPFVCKICNKGYKYLCNYRSHCKIHTDDAFVCKYCNKKFGRKSNYKEHVRIHTGEAPYKCSICDRKFKQHHGWKDHMRVHTGEKPYLCSLCGKRFTVGHNLNVHMRIHTGERPYQCNICKKSYRQKSAYNSHIKNVHGIKK